MKESIDIVENETARTFTITRVIVEEVGADQLVKINKDIAEAIQKTQEQVDDIEPSVEKRRAVLQSQLDELAPRSEAFKAHLAKAAVWAKTDERKSKESGTVEFVAKE